MTKCDFCTQSSPSGKCPYVSIACRQNYCDKAIKRMVKALGQEPQNKENGFWKKRKSFWDK